MKKLSVTVLHSLPNRVRLKLSTPIKRLESFKKNIKHNGGYLDIKYSPVTRTLVVVFDNNAGYLQEIIYKVVTAFSIENGLLPIRLIDGTKVKSLGKTSLYSAASISMSFLYSLMNRSDKDLQNIMNWFSLGLTSTAILEHAYSETKNQGVFDLEIFPAMYLMKSYLNSPKLSIVAMIWLTTFGRHLVVRTNTTKEVKVSRIRNHKDGSYHYITDIHDDNSIENISDLIYQMFFRRNTGTYKLNQKFMGQNKKIMFF